MAINRF